MNESIWPDIGIRGRVQPFGVAGLAHTEAFSELGWQPVFGYYVPSQDYSNFSHWSVVGRDFDNAAQGMSLQRFWGNQDEQRIGYDYWAHDTGYDERAAQLLVRIAVLLEPLAFSEQPLNGTGFVKYSGWSAFMPT